jgi:hypothetical protein
MRKHDLVEQEYFMAITAAKKFEQGYSMELQHKK